MRTKNLQIWKQRPNVPRFFFDGPKIGGFNNHFHHPKKIHQGPGTEGLQKAMKAASVPQLWQSRWQEPHCLLKNLPHINLGQICLGVLVQKSIQIQTCFLRHVETINSFHETFGIQLRPSDDLKNWSTKRGICSVVKKKRIENHEIPNVKRQQGKGVKV